MKKQSPVSKPSSKQSSERPLTDMEKIRKLLGTDHEPVSHEIRAKQMADARMKYPELYR